MTDPTPGFIPRNARQTVDDVRLILAIIASLLAIAVATAAFVKSRQVEKDVEALIARAERMELTVVLSEPLNGAAISTPVPKIRGSVDVRATASDMRSRPKMNLALREHRMELIPFVRPLSESKWWRAQASPLVQEDGRFEGSVFLGEASGAGVGIDFELTMLVVPRHSVKEGARSTDLPFYYAASPIITVRRVQ